MPDELKTGRVVAVRARVETVREWASRTLLWKAWDRMLEIEFVDRSIALAGKAFVSFFPLLIVVAAFAPERIRSSIITAVAARLGVQGDALVLFREGFASSDDVRKATGVLGLVLTVFFATSFTPALQRVYLRAWRRPPARAGAGAYGRGVVWLLAMLATLAILGALRGGPPPRVTARDGLAAIRIAEAAQRSLDSGRAETVVGATTPQEVVR